MTAVPMSGDANKDDTTARVQWSFNLSPIAAGACAIYVYVPRTDDSRDAAGHPAFYDVAAGAGGTRLGTFTIDQLASQGNWVNAGTYPVRTSALAITLHTRGIDFNNSGPTYAHLAAAQALVSCTASG